MNPQVSLELSVSTYHAYAPGADTVASWVAWRDGGLAPVGDEPPPLKEIKPMQRRRLSLLARCVFQVAGSVLAATDARDGLACVFASAIGQCSATLKMLETIAAEQSMSPQAFSLSVHNAIAGQFSIAHELRGPSLTLAPGCDGLGGVLLEAAALLAEPSIERVLLCLFDEPIPADLNPHEENPPTPLAAAMMVEGGDAEGLTLCVTRHKGGARSAKSLGGGEPFWREIRDFIAFLETPLDPRLEWSRERTGYAIGRR